MKKILITAMIFIFAFSANIAFTQTAEEKKTTELKAKIVLLQKILAKLLAEQKSRNLQNQKLSTNSKYSDLDYVFKSGIKDFQTKNQVSKLQKMLKNDGFLNDKVDGKFGKNTAAAVEKMKNKFGISGKKYGEFNPASLHAPEKNKSKYFPKKITEFLGSDQLEFYSLDFPFEQKEIKNIFCDSAASVKYIFKNGRIILPISFPYYFKSSKISCFLETNFSDKKFNFLNIVKKEVKRKKYYITLNRNASKKYIAPKKTDISRAAQERKMLKELYKNADRNLQITTPFAKPVNSIITSPFGTTRIFNGKKSSYHSGTDFRAYTGTSLKSVNKGKVILAKNLFYCGNTVIVNHGSGIFSVYCHLSKFNVSKGQKIKTGDIIGLSGSTGRVSAAHLHLSIKYDNHGTFQYIDFLDMLDRSESLE